MEHPATDIHGVIRDLTQGTIKKQEDTVNDFFVEDAAFVHPFVQVPRFSLSIPVLGTVNSRMVILAIYRWYRFMSPDIQLAIESSAFDKTNNIIYASISQRFAIWFIPLYAAHVRLVTVLRLVPCQIYDDSADPPAVVGTRYRIARQEDQYQINEWLKFLLPGVAAPLWTVWQLISAGLCVLLTGLSRILIALLSLPGGLKHGGTVSV